MQILNEKGITNAAALLGGTQAWQNAGYPMESSSKPAETQNKNASGNANSQSNSANKENKNKQ